ncbi:unnamed protein product, partial [Porites evermanni]
VAVKSFSGARLADMDDYLRTLFRKKPDEIILHVGTNNIRNESPRSVAEGIVNLVSQIQHDSPTTHLAISPLLPRSDNLDFNDKIREANNIFKSFCSSRGLTLLRINNIDLTCLNRRGVHLNSKGSSLLLNCHADYLKPAIPTTSRSNENSNHERISESDLTFSLPKRKGFKIAFLNIISLPKYLDKLRLRMQSQTLDLLASSETRLDNTFTDSAVSIDGYTLIRRDRCRGGGGVAIYICNVIDFKIRSDLLSSCVLKSKNPEPGHFLFQTGIDLRILQLSSLISSRSFGQRLKLKMLNQIY